MISMPSNQMNTSPQTIPTQIVLQKQQQTRAMHPNVVAQQQHQHQHQQPQSQPIIGANLHSVEFRQPAPANVVLQQNQIQPSQMQQFQQVIRCYKITKKYQSFSIFIFQLNSNHSK